MFENPTLNFPRGDWLTALISLFVGA